MTYKRRRYPSLGQSSRGDAQGSQELRDVATGSPVSPHYTPPQGLNSKDLVNYMLGVQQVAYGKTILDVVPYGALLRNMKKLLEQYSPEDIKREIALSPHLLRHPFSTKWLRTRLEG